MKPILATTLALLAATSAPASAQEPLEGRWANPHHSVIVEVARCGDAFCGVVSWATDKNRQLGTTPGTRVLTDLRPAGDGIYKGNAFEPKRSISGSATIRQVGRNVMMVKGCAVLGLLCREQRWTRVS